jgi:conjugal transfer pilus assembly protein TraE
MTPETATTKVRSISRITVLLAGVACALALSNVIMATLVMRQRTEAVLVPTMTSDMSLMSGAPSGPYMEMLTRDVASLFLNRHPNNTDYFQENVLRIVDSSVYAEMEQELRAMREERIHTRTSTVFHPIEIFTDPTEGYSEITGVLQTRVGDQQVAEDTRTYAARWNIEGLSVRLLDFAEIDRDDSRAREHRIRS